MVSGIQESWFYESLIPTSRSFIRVTAYVHEWQYFLAFRQNCSIWISSNPSYCQHISSKDWWIVPILLPKWQPYSLFLSKKTTLLIILFLHRWFRKIILERSCLKWEFMVIWRPTYWTRVLGMGISCSMILQFPLSWACHNL